MERRGHDLVAGRVREEVAGELVDRERVERLVGVERLDHPIAIRPHRAMRVALEAVGVGVAGEIEPLHGHVLAVVGRSQQSVEGLGPSVGRIIGEERLEVGVGRRQAGQVEGGAAEQGGLGGFAIGLQAFGGESRGEEGVDGVAAGGDGRDGRLDGFLESPVALVFGAFLDPAFDERDLFLGKHLVELRRWHMVVGVGRQQALHHRAPLGLAGHDGGVAGLAAPSRGFEGIQAQFALVLALVGAVAGEAGVGEDRADVAVELDALSGR